MTAKEVYDEVTILQCANEGTLYEVGNAECLWYEADGVICCLDVMQRLFSEGTLKVRGQASYELRPKATKWPVVIARGEKP